MPDADQPRSDQPSTDQPSSGAAEAPRGLRLRPFPTSSVLAALAAVLLALGGPGHAWAQG